jgi:hypothetical protein
MRSIKHLDKYLKIKNFNFQIVGLIGKNWVVKFNFMYLGYYPVNEGDIVRRIPKKIISDEYNEYLDTISGEYWFFGLNPADCSCAYSITEHEYNGGDDLIIDRCISITL